MDDHAKGFQLESSLRRAANAIARLCGGLAITTLSLVSHGPAVVTQGTRRWVDAQGFRGQSSRKIGWRGVHLALSRGDELTTRLHVAAEADPEPAIASTIQQRKHSPLFFSLEFHNAVA